MMVGKGHNFVFLRGLGRGRDHGTNNILAWGSVFGTIPPLHGYFGPGCTPAGHPPFQNPKRSPDALNQ